jgi:hypothetical protein
MQPLPRLHRVEPLHRDVDRNSDSGVPAVEQVVAVVDVGNINVVVVIPVIRPVFRPRVNETEPIALILEARVPTYNQKGQSVYAESMVRPKVSPEALIGNAVSVVATTLLPAAMVGIPVS